MQPRDGGPRGSLTYVGHATLLVDLDGVRLLTDPVLRRVVTHLRRRAPVDPGALRDIDAILVSHAHYDHLDIASLRRVGSDVPVVVPRGVGGVLRRSGFRRVTELPVGDELEVGALSVRAVPADHDGRRPPFTRHAEAVGYVVTGTNSVYFAGDTGLFDGMVDLAPVDLALIPVWGWGPDLGRGKHLDPERAAEAVAMIHPRVAVPIHWGTYHPLHLGLRRPPAYLSEPGEAFASAVARVAPSVDVRVLLPGRSMSLPL
jgi:L-ascorbate metabolism protein UlaG (beta-lactamase superfamily)